MTSPDTEALVWLIRKDGYFYRPNCQGYTTRKIEAGRYTKAKAETEAAIEPWHMSAIHQDDIPDEPAVADLNAEISRLTADNEALRKERDQARKEVNALLQSAARKGDEPDLLISEWHNALDRAERAEEAAVIAIDQAKAAESRSDALAQEVERLREAERILQNIDPENAIDDSLLRDIHRRLQMHGEKYPDRAVSVLHRNVVLYTIQAALRALQSQEAGNEG